MQAQDAWHLRRTVSPNSTDQMNPVHVDDVNNRENEARVWYDKDTVRIPLEHRG